MHITQIVQLLKLGYKAHLIDSGTIALGPIGEGASTPVKLTTMEPMGEAAIGLKHYLQLGWRIEDFSDSFVILAPPYTSDERVFVRVQ